MPIRWRTHIEDIAGSDPWASAAERPTVLPLTSSEEAPGMPAVSQLSTVLFRHHGTTLVTAAEQAQDTARTLRAKPEQNIIDCECRATKLALIQNKEAWRVYRRQQGKRAADFIPHLT